MPESNTNQVLWEFKKGRSLPGEGLLKRVHWSGDLKNSKNRASSQENYCRSLYIHCLHQNSWLPSGVKTIPVRSLRRRYWGLEMSSNLRFQTQVLHPRRTGLNHPANTQDLARRKGCWEWVWERAQGGSKSMISTQSCISILLFTLSATFRTTTGNQPSWGILSTCVIIHIRLERL